MLPKSAQELEHALLRLVGERQRGHRDRLAGRQRLAVGRFLVGIGQRQVGRTGLQHVDQVLVEELAEFSAVNALLAELLSRKSVPWVRFERPRPARLKETPVMLNVDFPVSLNVSFKVSPFNRLTPLNEASWAVVLIWFTTSLYCATRLFRLACEFGSATGAAAAKLANGVAVLPVKAPIVEEAASLVVTMLILPVVSMLACRLFAASASLSWLSVETCPAAVPNVMLVAVPPPVAAILSV